MFYVCNISDMQMFFLTLRVISMITSSWSTESFTALQPQYAFLDIHDLIMKLCFFLYLFTNYLPYEDNMIPVIARAMERTMNLSLICGYLNLEKNSEDNFIKQIENSRFEQIMWNMLFSWNFAWKGTILLTWKRNKSCKRQNLRIKIWIVVYWTLYSLIIFKLGCKNIPLQMSKGNVNMVPCTSNSLALLLLKFKSIMLQ